MAQASEALRARESSPARLPASVIHLLNGVVVDRKQIRSSTVRIALSVLITHSGAGDPCASGELLCLGQSRALRILRQAGVVAGVDDSAVGSPDHTEDAQPPKARATPRRARS